MCSLRDPRGSELLLLTLCDRQRAIGVLQKCKYQVVNIAIPAGLGRVRP